MSTRVSRADVAAIADALKEQAGTPNVRVLIARWMPFRAWRHGIVRELDGQPTILLEPLLLRLGREPCRATIAHELGHVALGDRFGSRSSERWTRRDDVLVALSFSMLLLCVPGGVAAAVFSWSQLAMIVPLVIGTALVVVIAARHGPARHQAEYDADAFAIRLLGERESTIALLQRSRPRFAPGPLRRLEEWLAWRIGTHPPDSARIEHAKNVPLPTSQPGGGSAAPSEARGLRGRPPRAR
jgi:Zn-dependent protease with chaperone function